ncbi:unnamed protein product [Rotaria sp. Silwood2]|nr:unnamed protein product [Rotaria sp. Silwood2]CAF4452148.1 unnamed protein product [Rotaria sp. Silwood2]
MTKFILYNGNNSINDIMSKRSHIITKSLNSNSILESLSINLTINEVFINCFCSDEIKHTFINKLIWYHYAFRLINIQTRTIIYPTLLVCITQSVAIIE